VQECGKADCAVVVWFRNNCGALAEGDDAYGYAYGPNKADAQQLALEKCGENTAGCEIICWACNTR
jgi:serine/threonine-protein kinase